MKALTGREPVASHCVFPHLRNRTTPEHPACCIPQNDAQQTSSTPIKAHSVAVVTALSCLVLLSYVPPNLDTSVAPEPGAGPTDPHASHASQAACGEDPPAPPLSSPAETAEPASDDTTPLLQQEGQEEREQEQPQQKEQAQQQRPKKQERPCPICGPVAAAGLAPHERVALGLLQQVCRVCADPDMYGTMALAVREAHRHRRKLLAGAGSQGEAEREESDAAKRPRTACGATFDRMMFAAKLHATSRARPERKEEYRRLEGAGRDGGDVGVAAPATALPPPPPPPPAQAVPAARVDVQPGAVGPGTVLLHERMTPEEVLSALLCTWLAASKRGQLVSWEQEGEASLEESKGQEAQGQQEEGREQREGQEGPGEQEQQQAAPERQSGQEQQGNARPAVRVVATDPSLLELQLTLVALLGKEDNQRCCAWQPSVDAHLANVLLPCDTPATEEVRWTWRWGPDQRWTGAVMWYASVWDEPDTW